MPYGLFKVGALLVILVSGRLLFTFRLLFLIANPQDRALIVFVDNFKPTARLALSKKSWWKLSVKT